MAKIEKGRGAKRWNNGEKCSQFCLPSLGGEEGSAKDRILFVQERREGKQRNTRCWAWTKEGKARRNERFEGANRAEGGEERGGQRGERKRGRRARERRGKASRGSGSGIDKATWIHDGHFRRQ